MDAAAVRIRLRDAQTRLVSAELQLGGDSPHEWEHAAEIAVSAGIAASDAICGHVLGYRAAGDAHREAVATLRDAANASTVLPVLRELVEGELIRADAQHYRFAARRLKRMRRLAASDPSSAEGVDAFIADLRERHRRRPRLQLEFTRAGLP
ncbi:hypothetical protein [Agromyces neolithicus]|uniref:DUF222 domain-containing protein n=1 Tax=Agromyces neolithicus TaxID=269420 RepID=A0ABN2M9J5_9MICO